MEAKTISVFVAAAALRLAIFYLFPAISATLSERVEIATPLSSHKRLLEGLFLFERGASPYDGGVYHQAPLLLIVFELFPAPLMYTALDLCSAYSLSVIASKLKLATPRFTTLSVSQIVLAYLFNPFTILTCLGTSTTTFTNVTILQAVASAASGNAFGAMFSLALGAYLSLYPALLLPPVMLLWAQAQTTKLTSQHIARQSLVFVVVVSILLSTSTILIGDFTGFFVSCYGAQINVTDLTPNIGLWWYFFIEIFDAFRNFFIGVFWLHLIGYVGALTTRLSDQPLFVVIALTGLFAIFKPYPSTADVSLYLGVLPLYKHIIPSTRYTFVAASVLLYSSLLGPAFYHIWIYAGSGNANFFYAITLVWSLGLSILAGDSIFAVLLDEWEMARPEMRGKEARQI